MRTITSHVAFTTLTFARFQSGQAWAPPGLGLGLFRRSPVKKPITFTSLHVSTSTSDNSINNAVGPDKQQHTTESPSLNDQEKESVASEAPSIPGTYQVVQHLSLEQDIVSEDPSFPDVKNLRVPQIHLPPRLAPNVGWQHHHQATTRLVHEHWNKNRKQPVRPPSQENSKLVSATPEWQRLEEHSQEIESTHLRELLQDEDRCDKMYAEHDGVYLDYSRQRATLQTLDLLQDLAKRQKLEESIQAMISGEKINFTENRAVLHTALRADRSEEVMVDGQNVIDEVHEVLDQVKHFTEGVRSGSIRGYTEKRLRNIVSVGIGGSYLGPEFLHEVLKTEPEGINSALGYSLRFLANVDPVDVERTCADLDPEETLILIVSKTFTTAETMLNARTMRQWLWDFMGNDKEVVRKHVVACASVSATDKVKEFGIDTENYFFRFWDWVGGRYSVCSAAGAVPISLLYGFDLFEKFLKVRSRRFVPSFCCCSCRLLIMFSH
jgi:hypothetical protein